MAKGRYFLAIRNITQWSSKFLAINKMHFRKPHVSNQVEAILSEMESAAAAAKSLQSCPTLCDPIDGSPPGSPISGILQAGTLEWVAISFSNAWK